MGSNPTATANAFPARSYSCSMRALGIDLSPEMVERFLGWFMPAEQPFVVPPEVAARMGHKDDRDRLTMELQDSFLLYSVDRSHVNGGS